VAACIMVVCCLGRYYEKQKEGAELRNEAIAMTGNSIEVFGEIVANCFLTVE
jgi:hypothetical protein